MKCQNSRKYETIEFYGQYFVPLKFCFESDSPPPHGTEACLPSGSQTWPIKHS